jgi:hypothetical protein
MRRRDDHFVNYGINEPSGEKEGDPPSAALRPNPSDQGEMHPFTGALPAAVNYGNCGFARGKFVERNA